MRTIILSLALFASFGASGQTLKAYIEAAQAAEAERDYYTAFVHYGTAVEIDENRLDLRYKMAEAARYYHAYATSEDLYEQVMMADEGASFPQSAYWLARMQHIQGKYDTAIANYQIYLGENSDDDDPYAVEANRMIEYCQWALDHQELVGDSADIEKLDSNVNTTFSEVAALKRDEMLYFSRLGYERKDVVKKREVPPSYLYSKVLASEQDSMPAPLDSTLNDSLNHTAHITFNHEETRLFYTVCEYLNKYDIRCDIYYRDIDSLGDWGPAQKLPSPINLDSFTNTQPHVAFDYLKNKDILYFVSNRPMGKGELDIWYSEINDDNTFTEPQNLAALNTNYNDITPFFHEESYTMYLSTHGKPGYGGYDIFKSEKKGEKWDTLVNLGPQINSSYDDVYYSLVEDESLALYSSNKVESQYLDAGNQACCYDIYKIEQEPIEVKLIVETFNKMTGEPLEDVTLYIEQRNGEVITVTQTTGASNRYEMELKRNRNWNIRGEKRTFNPDFADFSTYDIKESQTITKQLYLDPSEVVVEVRTFELRRRVPLLNVNVDLNDANGNLIETQASRYGHQTYFSVRPDEDYGLRGYRKGYLKAFADISKDELIGQDTIIKELYLELGNLDDFLPLAIYFDNDKKSELQGNRYRGPVP